MARRQKKRAETPSIARKEWDFSALGALPEIESLWICWVFEYSREFVKEGGVLPVELKELMRTGEGFPDRPFLILPDSQKMKIIRRIPTARSVPSLVEKSGTISTTQRLKLKKERLAHSPKVVAESAFIQDFVKVILLDKMIEESQRDARGKNTASVLLSQLKQLGVYRLFKAGLNVAKAMEHTEQVNGINKHWLVRSKWREYQREARRRLEDWPCSVIPKTRLPPRTEIPE
jgi:hypothetical protein